MAENIVILTGAGISAESGIKTFRAADGLWENHRVEDVATPEAFLRDAALAAAEGADLAAGLHPTVNLGKKLLNTIVKQV